MVDGPPRTAIGLRLFGRTVVLTGRAAVAVNATLLGALLAVGVYLVLEKPEVFRSPMWICAGLWIAMTIYWSKAARQTASIQSRESAASRSRHQLLLNLGLLFLFVRFPWTGHRFLPAAAWVVPVGLAVQIFSIVLDVWAVRRLGRNWSGAIAIKVDHELVRTGPYRFVRHPIYTAMIGMYLGTAIVSGELHGLLGLSLAVVAYARKTIIEERGLREHFGAAYEEYARTTRALIPWVF